LQTGRDIWEIIFVATLCRYISSLFFKIGPDLFHFPLFIIEGRLVLIFLFQSLNVFLSEVTKDLLFGWLVSDFADPTHPAI
jgi:hypothetical protein